MKIRSMFVGLLAVAGSSSLALADISGGPVFSSGVVNVRCMVFNDGPGTATITSNVITTGGTPIELNYDVCGATLPSGKIAQREGDVPVGPPGIGHALEGFQSSFTFTVVFFPSRRMPTSIVPPGRCPAISVM